jgi:hypothetical protein
MAASTSWLNATLAGTAGGITLLAYASVHNSTPGTGGAGEISGGSYARQANTNGAPSSAASSNSSSISWSIPASTAGIGWIGYWSASSGGTWETDVVLGTAVTFSSAGTLTAASGALTLSASQSA